MQNAIYKQIGITILRSLLTIAFASLVNHGLITEQQASAWVPEVAAGLFGLLVTLGFAVWSKVKHRVGFLAALELPAQSTPSDVKAAVEGMTVGEKWEVAKGASDVSTV